MKNGTWKNGFPVGLKRGFLFALALLWSGIAASTQAQIVINELVKEQVTTGGTGVTDTREFIELYNAGTASVDLSGWTVTWDDLGDGSPFPISAPIPNGASIGSSNYYVIGHADVPNVDLILESQTGEFFSDARALVFEIRNGSQTLIDAVACEIYRTGVGGPTPATPEQIAQFGAGFHGRLASANVAAPNALQSWGRWLDGRDSNNNGRDMGIIPVTPGTANNLPQVSAHTAPGLGSLGHGSPVPGYFASFVMPRAIGPAIADSVNPRSIAAPPGGGKAIIAWDETGGGNAIYSKEMVRSFDLYVYLDTGPLGIAGATASSTESTVYGIGTTDAFFATPDPTATIIDSNTVVQNGSTGIGWLYQRREMISGPDNFSKLFLIDFGSGGNARPTTAGGSWEIVQEIDVTTLPSGWYRLSLNYDAATGQVVAIFENQTFTFSAGTGLLGTFYVGYRTGISNFANNRGEHDPPTFIVQKPVVLSVSLTSSNTVMVSWPSPSAGFGLQQNTNLNAANWFAPAENVTDNGTIKFIIVDPPAGNRFYRLIKP